MEYVYNEVFRQLVHSDLVRTSRRGELDEKNCLTDFFAIAFIHTHRKYYLRFADRSDSSHVAKLTVPLLLKINFGRTF